VKVMKITRRKKVAITVILCIVVPVVIAQPVAGQSLFDAIFGPIGIAERGIIDWLDRSIFDAVAYTPSLNTPSVTMVWEIVWGIVVASLGILICGIGIMFMLAPVAEERWKYRQMLISLGIAFIVAASSLIIANFSVELNNVLCEAVMPPNYTQSPISSWDQTVNQTQLINQLGADAVNSVTTFFLFPLIILLQIGVLLICGFRILTIFFLGALLPLSIVLWSFHPTRQWGKRLTIMFFEWVFLGFFMSLALNLIITLRGDITIGRGNLLLHFFLFPAGYILLIMMPRIISVAGQTMAMASTGIGYMPVRQGMYTLGMALGTTPMLAIPKFALKTLKYSPLGIGGKAGGKVAGKLAVEKLMRSDAAKKIEAKAMKFKEFMNEPILGKSKVPQVPQRVEEDSVRKRNWDRLCAQVIEYNVKIGKIKPEDIGLPADWFKGR